MEMFITRMWELTAIPAGSRQSFSRTRASAPKVVLLWAFGLKTTPICSVKGDPKQNSGVLPFLELEAASGLPGGPRKIKCRFAFSLKWLVS